MQRGRDKWGKMEMDAENGGKWNGNGKNHRQPTRNMQTNKIPFACSGNCTDIELSEFYAFLIMSMQVNKESDSAWLETETA